VALAERLSGPAWSAQDPPQPPGSNISFTGVSCPSASDCTAVGGYVSPRQAAVALGESWNGTGWALKSVPNPQAAPGARLYGVACTSATGCLTVGRFISTESYNMMLGESWNGTRWAFNGLWLAAGQAEVYDVSCGSPVRCVAVGDYNTAGSSSVTLPFAEAWNGTKWTPVLPPKPPGTPQLDSLQSVSCGSATACVAVGTYENVNAKRQIVQGALAYAWNGTGRTQQTLPKVTAAALSGVSCTPSACTAVGFKAGGTGTGGLVAERWDGTGWTVQPTAGVPSGAIYSDLTGVSCATATACTAVGSYFTGSETGAGIVQSWDGTAWTKQTAPDPGGVAAGDALNAVSCTAPTACTAVGWQTGPGLPLVERSG
jgi:hypothetical protein